MSTIHFDPFFNPQRPRLSQPSIVNIPFYQLGEDLSVRLSDSLIVTENSNDRILAEFGRLWECILEKHRLPFLLLRVADMRMALGSKITALTLYEELQSILNDDDLNCWITQLRLSISEETDRMLFLYKNDPSEAFTPSQRWVSTAWDSFPHCKLEPEEVEELHDLWNKLGLADSKWHGQFLNMHSLETNYIEGTFRLDENDNEYLATDGFYDKSKLVKIKRGSIGGAVRNLDDVISILQDTHGALNEIYTFLDPDPRELTVEVIRRIHAQLMKTSQVLFNESDSNGRLSYTNIGITRQTSRVNVTASSSINGQPIRIQFCPYDEIEAELAVFCKRFNEILRKDDMDPFACAAWINHVFVTIHPFEDGNGRLSRILSSIPLVRQGLPPLCVSVMYQAAYLMHLNHTRATPRTGKYQRLMRVLFLTTRTRLRLLELDYCAERRAK